MNATESTAKTQKLLEQPILNGSANLKYTWQQFSKLPTKQRQDWLWFANVKLNAGIKYTDTLIEEKQKDLFTKIQYIAPDKSDRKPVVSLNSLQAYSAAQAMTILAYGDSAKGQKNKIGCRALHYNVKCEDFSDFAECVNIIYSYNEFNAATILNALREYGAKKAVYSDSNCNNGIDVFSYEIARECSPAFYIGFNEYRSPNVEVKRNGAEVEYKPYTREDFKSDMKFISDIINADEFSIEEIKLTETKSAFKARFWFD